MGEVRTAVPATIFACAQPVMFICVKKEPLSWNKSQRKNLVLVTRRTSWLFIFPLQCHPDVFFFFSLMFWEGVWVLLGREHCSHSYQTQARSGMGYVGFVQLV